jgi:hypothetical protein
MVAHKEMVGYVQAFWLFTNDCAFGCRFNSLEAESIFISNAIHKPL